MGIYRDLNDYEIMYMIEESDDAKELLFDKYRPIIINMANKYKDEGRRIGLELDDLVQEGYLGLYAATKNFNPNENTLFYTYALLSIKSKILNCLRAHNSQKYQNLNQSLSLSKPVFGSDDSTLIDYMVDKTIASPDDMIVEKETLDNIYRFLYTLNIELASVFELSLNGFSNIDISKLLDCSCKKVSNNLFRIRKQLQEYCNLVY